MDDDTDGHGKAGGMEYLALFNYALRFVVVVMEMILIGQVAYMAFVGVEEASRGKLIGVALGIVILTGTLAYMALHPPKKAGPATEPMVRSNQQ